MIIVHLRIGLHLPQCQSLKDKRSVLKRAIHHLRQNFNVAVAEVDDHDLWGSAVLSVVTVSNVRERVEATVREVVDYLDQHEDMVLVGVDREAL
mgnify:CR=1 FL=1|jgi:uncharacterized protein YlxP (DUF503 family)